MLFCLFFFSPGHSYYSHFIISCFMTSHLKDLSSLPPGQVRDNKKAGVFEPALSKLKQLKFATEAAITILRIDDMIKLEPEPSQESGYQRALQSGQLG